MSVATTLRLINASEAHGGQQGRLYVDTQGKILEPVMREQPASL